MMSLHKLPLVFGRHRDRLLEKGQTNVGDIVLHWNAASAPLDPNLESDLPAAVPLDETVRGFIHYVSVRTTERVYAEIRSGDVIVTFNPTVTIEGREGLYFVLPDGLTYVQAAEGKEVMEYWDVFVGGAPLTKTLLLRLKQ